MKRYKATILKHTPESEEYCNGFAEYSIIVCSYFDEIVIFIDESIKDKELLKFDVIKLASCFWFDDGEKYTLVTKDNYTDFDFNLILNEKTDKYNIETI